MIQVWRRFIQGVLRRLRGAAYIYREAMLWFLPTLLICSTVMLLSAFAAFWLGDEHPWVSLGYQIYDHLYNVFPIFMSAAIGSVLALKYHLARPPVTLLTILTYLIVDQLLDVVGSGISIGVLLAIVLPFPTIALLSRLVRTDSLRLLKLRQAGYSVRETLNYILPSILTLLVVTLVALLMAQLLKHDFGQFDSSALQQVMTPKLQGVVAVLANSLLWFFGVHIYGLQEFLLEQWLPVPDGLTGSFMMVFAFIGGSGSTVSLILALLIHRKKRAHTLLA